ncbi:MAG: DUF2807 domain-containing protein [Rikenellaceae bacterium]|nr:DUF2807 domain-containing protein [Rikenellaceae bacterium]
MELSKIYFCSAVLLSLCLGAVAQDHAVTEKITLFEGRTIENVELSGDFEIEIRQGTPNGVVLEVPQGIPVDTTLYSGRDGLYWLKQAQARTGDFQDTVQCTLAEGVLRLNNLRPKVSLSRGGMNLTWGPGPQSKAVVTISDLEKLKTYGGGTLRLTGQARPAVARLSVDNQATLTGSDLTAAKELKITVFNGGKIEGTISDVPHVDVKAFQGGQADLSIDGVGYLDMSYVDGGAVRVRGSVDSLVARTYKGAVDVENLRVGKLVQLEVKVQEKGDLSEWLKKEGYIIEKNGNSTVIRKAK